MSEHFIYAQEAFRKLRFAQSTGTSIYIYGATGFGKTTLIKEYLKGNEYIYLTPLDEVWNIPEKGEDAERKYFVVIDDLQLLNDDDRKQQIIELAERDDIWLITSGRMAVPNWMIGMIANGQLVVITEENLRLSADEIIHLAEKNGLSLTQEDAEYMALHGEGNPYIISVALNIMKNDRVPLSQLEKMLGRVYIDRLETQIIPQWDMSLQEFLMQLSVVDEFTLQLAVIISGDSRASVLLSDAMNVGNIITIEDDIYRLRPYLLQALRNRALKVFGFDKYKRYMDNAGLYYETQGDVISALKMYEKSGNNGSIRSLLIRNARSHFGDGHFYELRKYYMNIDESEISTSPILISTMSMLYSVQMNPEQSEYWYGKLKDFVSSASGGEKKEAEELLLYLNIALPHRGTANMLDVIKSTYTSLKRNSMKLPEFSLTSNLPSTMNGGKDFCNWSKHDRLLAETVGKLLENFLGEFGRGLVHAALCESLYEKGGYDAEVSHHAMLVHMEVEGGGKSELLFAAVGVQVRLSLLSGNTKSAAQILSAFEERVIREKKDALLPNIAAMRCRINLTMGKTKKALEWLSDAPNELSEFWVLDRYRYITKVLCYLTTGENNMAISLLEKLRYYAEVSKRTYIRMESGILLAIALKREGMEWKSVMLDAMNELCEYHFVRIISEKGSGVLPLLKEIKKDYLSQGNADSHWFQSVVKETTSFAERYPGFLNSEGAKPSDFSKTSMEILKLQADGFSIKEIAEKLEISERTAKYHASENYKKLGAKGKTDAVQIARSMNLI